MKRFLPSEMKDLRVAFLFPSLARGAYWQPILARFAKRFPNTVVFTGLWEGFLPRYQDAFTVKVVGKTRFIRVPLAKQQGYYPAGFVRVPFLRLLWELRRFKPHVLWVSGFSFWTLGAVSYKGVLGGKVKVIVIYDGSSPSVDRRGSRIHTLWRWHISKRGDAFITNTKSGQEYLVAHLEVDQNKILVYPYEVPDVEIWKAQRGERKNDQDRLRFREVSFVTVGRIIKQKGIMELMDAAKILADSTPEDKWCLNIIGDGPLRDEIERVIRDWSLEERVRLVGHVNYELLGEVLASQDVFIFPTLEDVWGLAPLEAMAMGKPVLCSKYAGVSELVTEGEDGWVFDPHNPEELARLMKKFIDKPKLISEMGVNAQRKMKSYTPEAAASFLEQVMLRTIAK